MKFTSSKRVLPSIELTPLIDIIFQLVLFFMVSATFQEAPSIEIQLPETSGADSVAQAKTVEIWIDEKGVLSVDGAILTKDDLKSLVVDRFSKDKGLGVTVNADGRVSHQIAVDIIDMVQQVGVENISIGTDASQ